MKFKEILNKIPHKHPYRFIDKIDKLNEDEIIGSCLLDEESFFYKGHFPESPITPGYIVTEIMAQIGILGLGIFIVGNNTSNVSGAFLTSTDVKFHNISYPGDTIMVFSKKEYFRFNKLKCKITAYNQNNDKICSGIFSGIIK